MIGTSLNPVILFFSLCLSDGILIQLKAAGQIYSFCDQSQRRTFHDNLSVAISGIVVFLRRVCPDPYHIASIYGSCLQRFYLCHTSRTVILHDLFHWRFLLVHINPVSFCYRFHLICCQSLVIQAYIVQLHSAVRIGPCRASLTQRIVHKAADGTQPAGQNLGVASTAGGLCQSSVHIELYFICRYGNRHQIPGILFWFCVKDMSVTGIVIKNKIPHAVTGMWRKGKLIFILTVRRAE